jgi:hypothetical protein
MEMVFNLTIVEGKTVLVNLGCLRINSHPGPSLPQLSAKILDMGEIEDIGRRIERDSANDIGDKLAHSHQVQQEVADLYHGDPAKFQAVLKFMANDTQYLKSLGLTQQIETSGNDITGIWFNANKADGAPNAVPSFLDTESFRHFLPDPIERKEAAALANSITSHDYGNIQAYLDQNASDPDKLTRIFQSFDVLNLNVGLARKSDEKAHTMTYSFDDSTRPRSRTEPLPSVTVSVAEPHAGYLNTDFRKLRRPGQLFPDQ